MKQLTFKLEPFTAEQKAKAEAVHQTAAAEPAEKR